MSEIEKSDFNVGLDLKEVLDISNIPGLAILEEESTLPPMELPVVQSNPDNIDEDLDNDYQIIRQIQLNQLAMLNEVAKQMVEITRNQETPKTVEIFSNLMDTITRTNSAVIDNYGKMKKLKNQEQKQPKTAIDVQFTQFKTMQPSELLQQEGTREDYLIQEQFKE